MIATTSLLVKRCGIENCEKEYHAKGYCRVHYNKLPYVRQAKRFSLQNKARRCSIEGCNEPHLGIGYCRRHYRNLPEVKERENKRRRNNPRQVELRRKYNQQRKYEVLNYYSNGLMNCACCGETRIEFLTINHLNKNGLKHRVGLKKLGTDLYSWLKKNNYPSGYNVLCMNCNFADGHYGTCPHQKVIGSVM